MGIWSAKRNLMEFDCYLERSIPLTTLWYQNNLLTFPHQYQLASCIHTLYYSYSCSYHLLLLPSANQIQKSEIKSKTLTSRDLEERAGDGSWDQTLTTRGEGEGEEEERRWEIGDGGGGGGERRRWDEIDWLNLLLIWFGWFFCSTLERRVQF